MNTPIQNVKVQHQNVQRKGFIIETKMDKVKVQFQDAGFLPAWFDKKEIKRLW